MRQEVRFDVGHNCDEYECIEGSKRCYNGSGGFHGKHGMSIRFLVHGEEGTVQFVMYTGWYPTESSYLSSEMGLVMPVDLGYHAVKPQYEGQSSMECQYLPGGKCYYDGSGLKAEVAYKTLINAGENDLWRFLTEYYLYLFKDGEYPEQGNYRKPIRDANTEA